LLCQWKNNAELNFSLSLFLVSDLDLEDQWPWTRPRTFCPRTHPWLKQYYIYTSLVLQAAKKYWYKALYNINSEQYFDNTVCEGWWNCSWWDCIRKDMKSFGLSRNDAEVGDHWGKRIKGATEYSNKPGLHGNGRKNINSHYVTFFTDDIELHRK